MEKEALSEGQGLRVSVGEGVKPVEAVRGAERIGGEDAVLPQPTEGIAEGLLVTKVEGRRAALGNVEEDSVVVPKEVTVAELLRVPRTPLGVRDPVKEMLAQEEEEGETFADVVTLGQEVVEGDTLAEGVEDTERGDEAEAVLEGVWLTVTLFDTEGVGQGVEEGDCRGERLEEGEPSPLMLLLAELECVEDREGEALALGLPLLHLEGLALTLAVPDLEVTLGLLWTEGV